MTVKLWTDTVTVSDKHAIPRTILKPEAATSGKLRNEPSWWIRKPRRLIPCTSAHSLCHILSTHRYWHLCHNTINTMSILHLFIHYVSVSPKDCSYLPGLLIISVALANCLPFLPLRPHTHTHAHIPLVSPSALFGSPALYWPSAWILNANQ